MEDKHEDIFKQLSATFSSAIVKKWLHMVELWEADQQSQILMKNLSLVCIVL